MDHQKLVSPTHSPSSSSPPQSASASFLITAAIVVLASVLLLITIYVIKCYTNCRRINRLRRRRSRGGSGGGDGGGFALSSTDDGGGGLDRSLIESIPTCEYARGGEWNLNSCECAVCLNEFRDEEKLRVIPLCSHAFHVDCIDVWLISNANCPLCRNCISASTVFPISPPRNPNRGGSGYFTAGSNNEDYVVIELGGQERLNSVDHLSSNISITPTPTPKFSRKLNHKKTGKVITSLGDECIDVRQRDEHFTIQPIRRSFWMDSAANQKLYLEVRKTLQQQKRRHGIISPEEGSSSSSSGSRIINKKSFFSFGYGRGSKNSVQTGSLGTLASLAS